MKKWLLISWLLILFAGISYLFWENEYKYSLPTPIPKSYHAAKNGDIINTQNKIKTESNKPLFLHFFNPACPCSRFNIPEFASLANHYRDKITFAIVILSDDTTYTVEDIQDKFGLTIPVLFDKSIADSCGVYSTPQAVIINSDHKLYYRGNYNKNRYCTLKTSNYAQMALDSLLNDCVDPTFSIAALKSYGCQLPNCKN